MIPQTQQHIHKSQLEHFAIMPPKSKNPDDDIKLLLACLTYGKPEINFNEVARVMGLKEGATYVLRWS